MPPDRFPPDDPREGLNRARSNLAKAKADTEEVYLEDVCLDAQQCAEKAIKAPCIHRVIPFPYIHDLAEWLTLLAQDGEHIPGAVQEAGRLTRFAVLTRSNPWRSSHPSRV